MSNDFTDKGRSAVRRAGSAAHCHDMQTAAATPDSPTREATANARADAPARRPRAEPRSAARCTKSEKLSGDRSSLQNGAGGVLPLPVLRDKHGQVIREFDILRVFHFYGRRRGKGFQKHYMHKIAVVKQWTNPRIGRQWWFHHTAEMGEGLTNGYCPYNGSGDQWAVDQTLEGVEVIDSPATLHDWCESQRIREGGGGAEPQWESASKQSAAATATGEDQSSGTLALGAVPPIGPGSAASGCEAPARPSAAGGSAPAGEQKGKL